MDGKQIVMAVVDEKSLISSLDRSGYREVGIKVLPIADFKELEGIILSRQVDVVLLNDDYQELKMSQAVPRLRGLQKELLLVATTVSLSEKREKELEKFNLDLVIEQPIPKAYFIEQIKRLLSQKTRSDLRIQRNLGDVTFEIEGKSRKLPIADLSKTGMLIQSTDEFVLDMEIKLKFTLPGEAKALKCLGKTVRNVQASKLQPDRTTGVGVQFLQFEGQGERQLQEFLERENLTDIQLKYYL